MFRVVAFAMMVLAGMAVMANEHAISTPPVGPTPRGVDTFSQMVPLGDGFLAVWVKRSDLLAIRIGPNGRPREAESFVVFHSHGGYPSVFLEQVASDGSIAFVLSIDGIAFRLDRVDADGTVTTLSANLLPVPIFNPVAMAANGGKLVILERGQSHLRATVIDRSGTVLQIGDVQLVDAGSFFYSVHVEVAGDGFLITWSDESGVAHVLGLGLSAIGAGMPVSSLVVDPDVRANDPTPAVNGMHAIVVWTRSHSGQQGQDLRARTISTSGTPLG